MTQTNFSICTGTGKIGAKRLKLYRERIKARGYKSLSRYVVDLMDRELLLDMPKPARRSARQLVAKT